MPEDLTKLNATTLLERDAILLRTMLARLAIELQHAVTEITNAGEMLEDWYAPGGPDTGVVGILPPVGGEEE